MDELAAAYGFVLRCSCAASVTHTVHAAVAALAALVQRSEVVPGTERPERVRMGEFCLCALTGAGAKMCSRLRLRAVCFLDASQGARGAVAPVAPLIASH